MDKVTVEITAQGWKSTINLDGKEYIETHKATHFGSEGVDGNFEDEKDIPNSLYDAMDTFAFGDIMDALQLCDE